MNLSGGSPSLTLVIPIIDDSFQGAEQRQSLEEDSPPSLNFTERRFGKRPTPLMDLMGVCKLSLPALIPAPNRRFAESKDA